MEGVTFGCGPNLTMWVAGCRGEFQCAGSRLSCGNTWWSHGHRPWCCDCQQSTTKMSRGFTCEADVMPRRPTWTGCDTLDDCESLFAATANASTAGSPSDERNVRTVASQLAEIAVKEAEYRNGGADMSALKAYVQSAWHPGRPGGHSCPSLTRLGKRGDGGKMVCLEVMLASPACRVISVGSQGDTSFERDVFRLRPSCRVDTWDGTIVEHAKSKRLRTMRSSLAPGAFKIVRRNFGNLSWQSYVNESAPVDMLKIDCERCEFDAVPAFVDHICTDQIVVEVHGCSLQRAPTHTQVRMVHKLMTHLDHRGFRVFASEPNIAASDGTCIEYSLLRFPPCPRPQP